MLESRAVTQFPLNDQEILLRLLHTAARRYVDDYVNRQPAQRQPAQPQPAQPQPVPAAS